MSSPFSDKTQSVAGLFGLNKNMQTHRLGYFMVAEVHEIVYSFIQLVSQLSFIEQLLVINTGFKG